MALRSYGGWGVYLFFAISGVLVCTRILEDESLSGRFRLGRFYLRRLFRIQPAAIAYIGAIALLSALGVTHERPSALFGALLMYQNYFYNAADTTGTWFMTGHFWTLAVEEHFYLLLSLLLVIFRRRRAAAFLVLIGSLLVWQRCVVHFGLYRPDTAPRRTELLVVYLLVPALLALYLRRTGILNFAVRFLKPWVAFSATFAIMFAAELVNRVPVAERGSLLAAAVHHPALWFYSFAVWVIATMQHPRSLTTRLLEAWPLRFLGRLSYSIYLWHVLFFAATAERAGVHAPWLLFLAGRPWKYMATLVMAFLSYNLVEKPLIRLGHRLAPPSTPGHADLATAETTAVSGAAA